MAVEFHGYERRRLHPSIVHIGPGVFHRAHQAVYCDDLLRTGAVDAAVWGISMRSSAVRDALAMDDFVYHVVERIDPVGSSAAARESTRAVGALLGITVAAEDVEAALVRLTDPAVVVVTITVTEHGYCATGPGGALDPSRAEIEHDLVEPTAPHSLPGLIVEALVRRRAAGVAPFTVASCDNLPSNGRAVARVVGDLAECRDPALAEWVAGNVAFPSSMVDRMVPSTTDADRAHCRAAGLADAWPIVTEPFRQWVLEDNFPGGRPDLGRVGVEMVSDVTVHEQAKLRVLNAAHSALAYWGLLAGHRFVWQAAADPVLLAATRELLEREVIPTLQTPAGWDLQRYADEVLDRFSNQALRYTTTKVACDGSQKLPVRLLPTIRALLDSGRPVHRCTQVLAAWAATAVGPRHREFDLTDDALARGSVGDMRRRASHPGPDEAVAALVALPGFLRADDRALAALVVEQARRLWSDGVHHVLASSPSTLAALHSEGTP